MKNKVSSLIAEGILILRERHFAALVFSYILCKGV